MFLPRKLARHIRRLREENEANESLGSNSVQFLRICRGCGKSPSKRFVAASCGEIFCSECARGKRGCPLGKEPTKFIALVEDENGSRECGICYCEQPVKRSVFRRCGHVFCSACLLQHAVASWKAWAIFRCPFCRVHSKFMPIKEVNDAKAETNIRKTASPMKKTDSFHNSQGQKATGH